jgi:bifunctional non-homologous end joining protein LigD
VESQQVAEVEFTEWTRDRRIRHPSFKSIREDKDPKGVTIERPADS